MKQLTISDVLTQIQKLSVSCIVNALANDEQFAKIIQQACRTLGAQLSSREAMAWVPVLRFFLAGVLQLTLIRYVPVVGQLPKLGGK